MGTVPIHTDVFGLTWWGFLTYDKRAQAGRIRNMSISSHKSQHRSSLNAYYNAPPSLALLPFLTACSALSRLLNRPKRINRPWDCMTALYFFNSLIHPTPFAMGGGDREVGCTHQSMRCCQDTTASDHIVLLPTHSPIPFLLLQYALTYQPASLCFFPLNFWLS